MLVDCGLFQGLKSLRERNWQALPVNPASIDSVVLTHAHLDHVGWLPRLVAGGFKGRVFCTPATADLAKIVLADAAKLQEEDAAAANREGYSRHKPALPLFTEEDAQRAMMLLQPVGYERAMPIAQGVEADFINAGHLLGSAYARVLAGGLEILFGGDLGRYDRPILPDPSPVESADILLLESTYGDRQHAQDDNGELLARVITETAQRGGKVIVPAFAIGRVEEVIYWIKKLEEERRIPTLPVYLDSPMAAAAIKLYEARQNELDAEVRAVERGRLRFLHHALQGCDVSTRVARARDRRGAGGRHRVERDGDRRTRAESSQGDAARSAAHSAVRRLSGAGDTRPAHAGRRAAREDPWRRRIGGRADRRHPLDVGARRSDGDPPVDWIFQTPPSPNIFGTWRAGRTRNAARRDYTKARMGCVHSRPSGTRRIVSSFMRGLLMTVVVGAAVASGCGDTPESAPAVQDAKPASQVDAGRKYLLERVDDAAVAQLYADGFEALPLREKTLIWHLYQAAIAGRDIYYDQRYRHNLEMREVLEQILTHAGGIDQGTLDEIRALHEAVLAQHRSLQQPDGAQVRPEDHTGRVCGRGEAGVRQRRHVSAHARARRSTRCWRACARCSSICRLIRS